MSRSSHMLLVDWAATSQAATGQRVGRHAACLEYGRRFERVARAAQAFVDGIFEPSRIVLAVAVRSGEIDGPITDRVAERAGPPVLFHVMLGETLTADQGAPGRSFRRSAGEGLTTPGG